MATPNENEEWISEEDLARELGVKRAALRNERPPLKNGEAQLRGNMIYWLKKTALATASKLGLSGEGIVKKTALATASASAGGELLTVVSSPGPGGTHFSAAWLIKARRANGEVVVVRVVNSAKYRPIGKNGQPMQLRATPAPTGSWWVPAGREPRFIGAF